MSVARFITASLLAVTVVTSGGCAPANSGSETALAAAPAEEEARHPVSGLPVIPVSIQSASDAHEIAAELAQSGPAVARGLMFRTEMGANEGMLFQFDPPRAVSFWMKNTVIPLDIIFIGEDGRILNIAANTVPYDESLIPADGITAAVLEVNAGRAAELGIRPGDKVSW